MKSRKPPGADRILLRDVYYNPHKLKCLRLQLLIDIFVNGEIPKVLKCLIVRILYNTRKRKDPVSFRPIPIIPVISHIMQIYIGKLLTTFHDTFFLTTGSRYGFRHKKGTTDLVETFPDFLNQSLDNTRIAHVVFLDLSKAIDTVDHCCIMLHCINKTVNCSYYL